MKNEMRRKRQALGDADCKEVLFSGTNGILALTDDGQPYAVPLSYVYDGGDKIYFHCAKSGYKLELIAKNPKCSFCVVNMDKIVPEKYTTYFKSVIVCGDISVVGDDDEKKWSIKLLAEKYCPNDEMGIEREIAKEFSALNMLRLDIKQISGKEAIELVREKEGK